VKNPPPFWPPPAPPETWVPPALLPKSKRVFFSPSPAWFCCPARAALLAPSNGPGQKNNPHRPLAAAGPMARMGPTGLHPPVKSPGRTHAPMAPEKRCTRTASLELIQLGPDFSRLPAPSRKPFLAGGMKRRH